MRYPTDERTQKGRRNRSPQQMLLFLSIDIRNQKSSFEHQSDQVSDVNSFRAILVKVTINSEYLRGIVLVSLSQDRSENPLRAHREPNCENDGSRR